MKKEIDPKIGIGDIAVCSIAATRVAKAMQIFNEAIEAFCKRMRSPIRIRTGIAPKRGRTRKKQRLTRLQRRVKRQNK